MKTLPRLSIVIALATALLATPTPSLAQEDIGFLSPDDYFTDGEPFADETVAGLLETLGGLLARPATQEDFGGEAGTHLWRFTTRLAMGRLTPEQVAEIVAYLDSVATDHPADAEMIGRYRYMVENLMIGSVAPNIVGKDFDGVEFELVDYRGKIVALVFTGQWCGPCRSEYPYQRLFLEVMADEPVVLLGVNSDESIEFAQEGKEAERLDYRMWWDGHGEESTKGPIATQWNVTGWPTIYVIDEEGVIRARGPRHEKLITAVKVLLAELRMKQRAEGIHQP